VLKRMQAAMTKELDALWAKRRAAAQRRQQQARGDHPRLDRREGDRQAVRAADGGGVYSNRLRIGMKLDADPTVIYPITKGKPLGRRILRSELNANNGYNTYAMAGLPPGRSPIRGASRSRRC
jgi:UPF0755 protein